jgi:hypothetical protein
VTISGRWRAFLRRLRIGGESRWIVDPDEREAHRARVRRRLRRNVADDEPPPPGESAPAVDS